MSKNNIGYIPDPTIEDGFEGIYCGNNELPVDYEPEPLNFDLRKAAKYVRDNNLPALTDEIKKMFKK